MAAPSTACTVFEHWHPVLESYRRHGSPSMFSSEFCCSLKAVVFPNAEPPSTDSHGRSQKVSYIFKHSEANSELAPARARVIVMAAEEWQRKNCYYCTPDGRQFSDISLDA